MQLAQPARGRLVGGVRRQVEQHRPHLGAQEVIRARRAERGQRRVPGPGQEVEHGGGVGVVPDLPAVGRGQAPDQRGQLRRPGAPAVLGQRLVPRDHRAERIGDPVLVDVPLRGADDLQRARLALVAGLAPGGDAVTAQDDPDRLAGGPRLTWRRCPGRAGSRAAATAPTPPGRRSRPWSAPRRRGPRPARCPRPGAGGRRAPRRPGRAWRCRWTGPRRRCPTGSSRTRRPSRPRAPPRGTRRPARGAGPAGARPGPSAVSVPRSPPEPLTQSSSACSPVTGSVTVPLAEVLPPA